jgi:hypothetical protein
MSSRCRRVQSDQLLEKLTEILLCGLSEGLTADLVIGQSFVRVHKKFSCSLCPVTCCVWQFDLFAQKLRFLAWF